MYKQNQILILLCIILFGMILSLLLYQSLPKKVEKRVSEKKGVVRNYNFSTPNKVNTRATPANPLDITLEYGFEISPGQAFTTAILENATLVKSAQTAKENILTLEKNGIKIELPMVGMLGLQMNEDEESKPVKVENIYEFLKVGDNLKIRMNFAGSNITLSNSEIIAILEQRLKGNPNFELMMKANSLIGVKRLYEKDFVQRLHKNPVIFAPEELLILSINKVN